VPSRFVERSRILCPANHDRKVGASDVDMNLISVAARVLLGVCRTPVGERDRQLDQPADYLRAALSAPTTCQPWGVFARADRKTVWAEFSFGAAGIASEAA
jgi:hypothetical protein